MPLHPLNADSLMLDTDERSISPKIPVHPENAELPSDEIFEKSTLSHVTPGHPENASESTIHPSAKLITKSVNETSDKALFLTLVIFPAKVTLLGSGS